MMCGRLSIMGLMSLCSILRLILSKFGDLQFRVKSGIAEVKELLERCRCLFYAFFIDNI
jgi:hypothetical protein